jgi:LuxR family maltose regulon positive regulatory protein
MDASNGFPARTLAARTRGLPAPPIGFSGRELDVLARLPSLLSLDDIAVELGVSVNTIKSHLRSIYAKLGATSRRAAVLAAHEQGALA